MSGIRSKIKYSSWSTLALCIASGAGGKKTQGFVARRDFVPTLRVAAVRTSNDTVVVSLPANTSAFATANIFARASGYIEKRNVDIGDRVKEGQLLVEIMAPELDHQISQAEATLNQLEATVKQAQANHGACTGDLGAQ